MTPEDRALLVGELTSVLRERKSSDNSLNA